MPRPPVNDAAGPARGADVSSAFVHAAQMVMDMRRNAEEHERLAAASGNLAHWQRYTAAAQAEEHDRSALGRPIPLLILGFGAPGGRRSLATQLIRQIIASRQQFSEEFGVHFPMLGIADHAGSFSPHKPLPYQLAVRAGLTDAGMMQVALGPVEDSGSLRGSGHANTKDVVANGGQRGCVLLDLAEDKKAQAKALPGLLLGGERGYYAVVVGKRSEALSAAIGRAYPAERLLRLSAADLEAGAAAAGLPGSDPLQRKAQGLLRRLAAWYLERPEVQQEVARLSAARQQFAAAPQRRRDAEREAAELAAMPGQPLCPCGCGQEDVVEHMTGLLTVAMGDPTATLARFQRGDATMAVALANIVGVAVGPVEGLTAPQAVQVYGGDRLLDAVVDQMVAARERRDYELWRACLALAANCTRFEGEAGDRFRRRLLERGLGAELVIARGSKDVHSRDAAGRVVEGLTAWGAWQRQCHHCGRREPEDAADAERLLLCKGCRRRPFCGKECLAAAWPAHKRECKQLAAL